MNYWVAELLLRRPDLGKSVILQDLVVKLREVIEIAEVIEVTVGTTMEAAAVTVEIETEETVVTETETTVERDTALAREAEKENAPTTEETTVDPSARLSLSET